MTAQSALAIGVWCGSRACTAWGKPGKYLQLSPEGKVPVPPQPPRPGLLPLGGSAQLEAHWLNRDE